MWLLWLTIGLSIGACIGFVTLAIMTMAKGDADDQRQSDQAELDFMRRWQASRR